ncbi:CHAT domain-containing and and tetratricopeptide repeat-containing protein [Desulfonema limicola]|uniref:CHAT domain-containing and and tetratricopeptide repeat-containing protein n=1 Tax=Desulfonema limicola TaxID=45656 RepID=A0A975GIG0_9BACT|nr:CHAT domain-containing and and tetratricopeptide repeat-containing protein [Desulfonema limicola]
MWKKILLSIRLIYLLFIIFFLMYSGQLHAETESFSKQEYKAELSRLHENLAKCRDDKVRKTQILTNMGVVLNRLAMLYSSTGDYSQAKSMFEQALSIDEKLFGKDHPKVAIRLNNLALIHYFLGDYFTAKEMYEQALKINIKNYDPEHPKIAMNLSNLGMLCYEMGDFIEAEMLYERSLDIKQKKYGFEDPKVAIAMNNLALVFEKQGRYAEAKTTCEQIVKINEKNFGSDHPIVAMNLNNLGWICDVLGEYSEALDMYKRALLIAEGSDAPDLLLNIQDGLCRLLAHMKDYNTAIFFGKQSVNVIQSMRRDMKGLKKELQKSFLSSKQDIYKYLADLLIDQGRIPEAQQVLAMLKQEEYFDFIRRDSSQSDTRTTLASYTEIEEPWQNRYNEIKTGLASMGKEYGELKQKKKLGLSPEENARFKQLKQDLNIAGKSFEKFLAELVTELGQVSTERAADIGEKNLENLQALQGTLRKLGHGCVTVHYLMTEKKLRIILTTQQVQLVRDSEITESELNRLIFAFRQTLQNPHTDPVPQARVLYDAVLKPIAEDLKQAQAQTLMVSLDGTMRYLPISALHNGTEYAAQQYRIVIFTQAAGTKLTDAPEQDMTLAGLGLTHQVEGFSALPAVKKELEGISLIVPGVIHMDEAFTKTALTDALDTEYPLLHIASHFVFNPGTEKDSYLVLGDGSRLLLSELREKKTDFDFNSVDLLALSACNTAMGGGKNANGREIEGFGVQAQKQGAKAVLATLWPVADQSTGIFMQNMYRLRRKQKITKAEAVQQAQVMFIKGGKTNAGENSSDKQQRAKIIPSAPKQEQGRFIPNPDAPYAHPYYWAPFILMGNWL